MLGFWGCWCNDQGGRLGLDYYIGAVVEMYHKLGCGICTVISVLKPSQIIGLFSTSLSNNQDFLSQESPEIIKLRGKMFSLSLSIRPSLFPPETWLQLYLICPKHKGQSKKSFITLVQSSVGNLRKTIKELSAKTDKSVTKLSLLSQYYSIVFGAFAMSKTY